MGRGWTQSVGDAEGEPLTGVSEVVSGVKQEKGACLECGLQVSSAEKFEGEER